MNNQIRYKKNKSCLTLFLFKGGTIYLKMKILLLCFIITNSINLFGQTNNLDIKKSEIEIKKLFTELSKNRTDKISSNRWFNENCYTPQNVPDRMIGYNSLPFPEYFRAYYQIFNYYDSALIKNKCIFIWDTVTKEYLMMNYKIENDNSKRRLNTYFWYQDNKLEKELFRTYKKWVKKVNRYGLTYMIDNKISPLDNSRFIWKER